MLFKCNHRTPCGPHWSLFPKAFRDRLTVWGAWKLQPSRAATTHPTGQESHTHRHVCKGTAGVRCPDVFGVRIPNNGRVLAAAISHQVVHVALPGHFCEIISKMRVLGKVGVTNVSQATNDGKEAVFITGLTGLQHTNPPGTDASRLSSGRQWREAAAVGRAHGCSPD